jgi:hypothetical protein
MNTDELNYHFFRILNEKNVSSVNNFMPEIISHIKSGNWQKTINLADSEENFITPNQDWRFMACMLLYAAKQDVLIEIFNNQFNLFNFDINFSKDIEESCFDIVFDYGFAHIYFYGEGEAFEVPWYVASRFIDTLSLILFCIKNKTFSAKLRFNMHDCGAPLQVSFCSNSPDSILIPDMSFLSSLAYRAERLIFSRRSIAWDQKLPVAFWRGTTTGPKPDGWRSMPRVQLCELGRDDAAGSFDCGITGRLANISDEEHLEMQVAGIIKPIVPSTEFDRYRYHIDIDGNTNSWPGLFIKLLTGGPVLKVASQYGFRQWYYDRLIPWENYVPIASDLSDLREKLNWLIQNDDKSRLIGSAGRELAESMTVYNQSVLACNYLARGQSPSCPELTL